MVEEELSAPLVRIEVEADKTIKKLEASCYHDTTHTEQLAHTTLTNGEPTEVYENHIICDRCDKDVCPKRIHD